jgi:hypothetical protein
LHTTPTVVAPGIQLIPPWACVCGCEVVCSPYPSISLHLFLLDNTRQAIKLNLEDGTNKNRVYRGTTGFSNEALVIKEKGSSEMEPNKVYPVLKYRKEKKEIFRC